MSSLNSFEETDMEHSLATTDDLIRFWRLKLTALPSRYNLVNTHIL